MNNFTRLLILALSWSCLADRISANPPDIATPAPNGTSAEADAAWAAISAPIDGLSAAAAAYKKYEGDLGALFEWQAKMALQSRERGAAFFLTFPQDSRRLEWFHNEVLYSFSDPNFPYYKDIKKAAQAKAARTGFSWGNYVEIDEAAKLKWEGQRALLAAAYSADSRISDEDRWRLRDNVLKGESNRLSEQLDTCADSEKERTLIRLAPEIWRLTGDVLELANSGSDLPHAVTDLEQDITPYNREMWEVFHAVLRQSKNAKVQSYVANRDDLFKRLRSSPAKLRLPRIDGTGEVDFDKMRGKVIAVDYWWYGCSGCRAGLAGLDAIYGRYSVFGFELVGVCYLNGTYLSPNEKDWRKAGQIEKEADIAWLKKDHIRSPQGLAGPYPSMDVMYADLKELNFGSDWENMGAGTLLFDQGGHLVLAGPSYNHLEYEIRRLLGLPPSTFPKPVFSDVFHDGSWY